MKKLTFTLLIAFLPLFSVQAEDILSGDKRLACEALLCLASGQRPDECDNAIRKYFSIHERKPSDTLKARRNFLKLCPTDGQDELINALAEGAGNCDADELTFKLNRYIVETKMPSDDGYSPWDRNILRAIPSYCLTYQTVLNSGYGQDVKLPTQQTFCYTVPYDETTSRECTALWVDPNDPKSACGAANLLSIGGMDSITDDTGTQVCL